MFQSVYLPLYYISYCLPTFLLHFNLLNYLPNIFQSIICPSTRDACMSPLHIPCICPRCSYFIYPGCMHPSSPLLLLFSLSPLLSPLSLPYMHVYACIYMYVCMYVCMHACMHACMRIKGRVDPLYMRIHPPSLHASASTLPTCVCIHPLYMHLDRPSLCVSASILSTFV
jgi:hypothetical protein